MFRFYQEKKYLSISLLVIILDGVITYLIPSYFNKLNYFYPMLTISLIPIFINKKNYYLYIILLGSLYDLLYSSIFLYHIIIFIILINIDIKIAKYFKYSLLLFLLLSLLNIIIYDGIGFILIIITSYQQVNFYDLIYKIDHSILLNIMSVFVFWFMFKKDIHHT